MGADDRSDGIRSAVRRNWWRAMAGLEPWDPTPYVAARRFHSPPPAAVLLIYRYANAMNAAAIRRAAAPDTIWRLWALDRVHPELEPWTVGEGPGLRSPLLDKLYATLPAGFDGHVVLSDDDYVFTRGDLSTFLSVVRAADLGLAQPGHDRVSRISHWVTAGRRLSLMRLTSFVEIGPLVAVAPEWRARVLPLADEGMGWGLDLRWSDLRGEGCRLGVVDSCLIRHLFSVIGSGPYDVPAAREQMEELYEERGGYHRALCTLATWWPWEARTPRSPDDGKAL